MYSGSSKEDVGYGHSHDVCIELMSPLSGQGYHLFTDNFYTSVPLAISLLLHKTDLTGTVRGNRKYLPPGVKKQSKAKKGDIAAYKSDEDDIITLGWLDKKHVIMITTSSSSEMVNYRSKRNREHVIPSCVRSYNLNMGGVDLADMRIYQFLDERRTVRWNKKVFFAILGRCLLNAFIIYQQNTSDNPKLDRRSYKLLKVLSVMSANQIMLVGKGHMLHKYHKSTSRNTRNKLNYPLEKGKIVRFSPKMWKEFALVTCVKNVM